MPVSDAIRARLLQTPLVLNLLPDGPHDAKAVFTSDTPQKAPPTRVEVHELNLDPMLTLGGTSGLRSASIDVDCKATSGRAARALADAVESALNDYEGTVSGVAIKAVLLQDRSDSTETPQTGNGQSIYVTTLDYQVQFQPAE